MRNKVCCLVAIMLIGWGCQMVEKQKNRREILSYYGRKIELPSSEVFESSSKKMLTISTFINGNCPSCIEELKLWDQWIDKNKDQVNFLIYYHAFDTLAFKRILSDEINFNYPVINDSVKGYLVRNKLPDLDKMLQTLLLNEDNEVVLVGNPILSDGVKKLYQKTIDNITSCDKPS